MLTVLNPGPFLLSLLHYYSSCTENPKYKLEDTNSHWIKQDSMIMYVFQVVNYNIELYWYTH